MTPARWGLALLFAVAIAAFFALGGHRYLTLEQLRQAQGGVAALYAERPLAVAAAYFALYVAVTALSLPGALVMTLAGGAIFGLGVGTLLVSFASTIGATLAMLAARYLLRGVVQTRFGDRLAEIDRGIQRDGALYLFTLRLVPVLPFFLINVLMGLTAMRAGTFYIVSQVGMLAGTLVYVNAGTQLAQLRSLQDIVSPGLLGSFVLLGLFPFVTRWLAARLRERRVYARWAAQRPKRYDRNLVVIGAGAAGLVTSYIAAAVKAKVTLVESHRMGGDCLNYGCVPSKALIRTATLVQQMRHAERYGVVGAEVAEGAQSDLQRDIHAGLASLDFGRIMDRVARVVADIAPHDSVERYAGLGVEVLEGRATLVDPWHVRVDLADGRTQTLSTRAIVIATGARPIVPPLPGLQAVGCLTSDTLWGLRTLPARLVVLGGGPIGCELAQAFARLGSQVTQVEMAPRLMGREDEEVSAFVRQTLESDGVTVLTGHRAVRCEQHADGKRIVVEAGGREHAIAFDELLCAVGRAARLEGYGLETLGIASDRTLQVNEYLETTYPNILAAGDVAGPYQLTHVAAHQAWYAAVNGLFGGLRKFKADYRVIPWTTFVDPEVARVGLNEQEARAQGVAFEVTRYDLDDLDRAIADSATRGWVKVLTAPGRDRILGVTIVGAHAGDLLAEYVLAMKHGLGLNQILGTIHTYPTMAEANKYAAGAWKRAHQPERLLRWVAKFHAWRRGE